MAVTIQSILQQHFHDYFGRHRWPKRVLQAAQRMRDCRTAAMGGHVQRCPNGHVYRVHYNSCRHRSCPACGSLPGERWLAGWKERLLQTDHRHLVFTLPDKLDVFWQYNRAVFSDLFFSSVRETLLETAQRPSAAAGGDPSQPLRRLAHCVVTLPEFQLA